MSECANTVGQYRPQQPNAPYGNTYNSNWRNHPNLSWKPTPTTYVPSGAKQQFGSQSQPQLPPSSSPVEQAILNLSKVVGNFVEEQKGINVQLAQRIDTVESTLNKRIDGLESNLNQKIDNLQYSITKINKLLEVQERGRVPSQTVPNPKGIHEVGSSNNSGMDEVKAIITLRSGKEVDQPMPKPVEESRKGEELQSDHIFLKEDSMKYNMPPPFPQALRSKKKASQQAGILEVLRQVKVIIPLLDIIKQVPAYAKFLKDLCTIKKGLGIEKKAFLTEQVSAIIQSKNPIPGNVRLHRREFHQESYYEVPALMADPRFRDLMRLIEHYSLLPFMTPRQYYYPRVVLQFYHSMTSRGASSLLELRFSIDDRPGVLRAADISAALGLHIPQAN